MKPPNITLRLAAAFSLLAAVLVVVGWQGVRHLRQLNREMQEVIFNRRSEEQLVHEAFRLSDQNSRMMLSIFLRDDPDEIKRLLVQRAANSERISELLRAIEPRLDTAEEKRLLGAVRAARKPYVESYKRALAKLLDEHQRDEARKMMVEVTLPGIAVYHDAWDAFTQCQVDRIEQAIKQSKADFAAAQRRLLFLIILAALITSATAVYATRGVARATAERERAENALRLSRDQLEQRIEQRTAELAKSNQALQAEIIERQHTEEQLRAQTTALDAAANAIVIADHNGSIQSVNAAFTALTGYTAQEVVGHNPRLLKSGQHDEAFYLNLWQTISSGQVWSGELTNRRKDGSLYDEEMTITPLRNADGVIARYLAIKQDITKRKRVEEALRASQQIIEGIINAIPVRVFWKDKNLVYLGCNAAFARDAGFADPKDLIGKDDYQMGWRDQAEKYREDDRQVIQSGRSKLLIEEPQTTPDGNTITILTSKILLRDSAGKTSGMIGTYLDITERKRAEEELQRKTAFLEAQVNSSIDGILVVDQNRETSLQNQRFVDMFKMPRHLADAGAEAKRLRWVTDLVKNPEQFLERVLHLYAHPNEITHDEIELKDGTILDRYTSPAIGKDGKYYGRTWTYRDITVRKRAEVRLQQSERRTRAITDSAQDAILMMDTEGRVSYWNPAAEHILGYTSAEALGQNLHDLIAPARFLPAHRAAYPAFLQTSQGTAVGKTVDLEARRKDGLEISIQLSLSAVQMNEGWHAVGIIRDTTERKRAEKALRESNQKFQDLFESSRDAITTSEPPVAKFTSGNPAAVKMFGAKSEEEFISYGSVDLSPDLQPDGRASAEKAREMIETAMREGSHFFEWTHRRIGGEEFPSTVLISRSQSTEKVTVQATIRDITESKRAQVELESLHKQLLESSRLAGMAEIATNVLHNVGNVLNSVNISTDLIVDSVKKSKISSLARVVVLLQEHAHDLGEFITHDPSGQHVPSILARLSEHLMAEQTKIAGELDSLRRNVEHINEIVAMQQNYAAVGGVNEAIDLVSLVEDSLRLNEGSFKRHGVEIIRELAKVPPMNVEKHKILQILVNLVRNAKYACDDSGLADRRLTVRVANGDGRVKISILDNGIGIPPENLTRIFNYGFTTRRGGHGFGLHSSALAAKEMGGSLTVCSAGLGQGATFTLELPCPTKEARNE